MRIDYIKLENFLGIYAGMGKTEIEIDFKNNKNKIIILNAANGKGKTTLLSMLHPLRETFDDRKDIVIPGELGCKIVDLTHNGIKYHIEHTYGKKNKSFISKDGEELNENGNIKSFNQIAKDELGIDGEYFKIGRIGSNVSNFIDLKATDRKKYITEFIPSIDEYLKAFDVIKEKYTSYNTQLKFIKNTIEKYSGLRELDEIKSDIKFLNKEIKEHEDKLLEIKTSIEKFQNMKEILEKNIINYINDIDIIEFDKTIKNISDLDYFTMFIDNKTSEIEDSYNIYCEKESNYISKYNIRVEDNILEYIKKLEEKFNIRLAKYEETFNTLNTNLKNLESEKISALNKVEYYKEKIDSIGENVLSKEEVESNKKAIEENNKLLNEANKLLKIYGSKFDGKTLDSLMTYYISNHPLYIGEDLIDNIEDIKGQYEDTILDEYYCYDNIDFVAECKKLDNKFNNKNIRLIEVNKLIGELEGKISYVDETLPKRSPNCNDDTCSFIKSALEIQKRDIPKYNKLIKEKSELEEEIAEINSLIDKYNKYITIDRELKNITDKVNNNYHPYFAKQILNNNLFVTNNTMLLENIGIYNFQKALKNRNIAEDLKDIIYKLEKSIENFEISEELINEYTTNYEEAINTCSNLETKIEETKNSLKDISLKKADSEKRINICKEYYTINNELNNFKTDFEKLVKIQKDLISLINEYNKFKKDNNIDTLESEVGVIEVDIAELKSKLENNKTSVTIIEDNMKKLSEIESVYNSVILVKDALDPKKGIPVVFANEYLKSIATKTNKLLEIAYDNHFKIRFNITSTDFLVEVYKSDGTVLTDIKLASQGETSLTNVSLSLAMLECMIKKYNIVYLDEVDCTLSTENRKLFIELLENQMDNLNIEQCFVITHNNEFYDKNVDLILLEGHDCDLNDKDFMNGKNIIFKI